MNCDQTLRQLSGTNMWDRENIKKNLQILLGAAKTPAGTFAFFYGPSGLGKTTLAPLIAKETSSQMRSTSGPCHWKKWVISLPFLQIFHRDIFYL